jgi:hypothetical protein
MGLQFGLVLGASVVDEFLDGWNTQIIVDHGVVDIPWGVNYCSYYF